MTIEETLALMDHVEAYIEQIKKAEPETARLLMKEFADRAFKRGWNKAVIRLAHEAENLIM